jgi:EAL domain-containing protein (putative c-di-GMP-specific phosphodiesterase class I)
LIVLFSATVALGLAFSALLIGGQLKQSIVDEGLHSAETTSNVFASITLDADEFEHGRPTEEAKADLTQAIADSSDIRGLRVWSPGHELLYGSSRTFRQNENSELSEEFLEARRGETSSEITSLASESAETEYEPSFEEGDLIEVYLPIRAAGEKLPRAVLETYMPYDHLRDKVTHATRRLYAILFASAVLLFLALLPTLIRSSRALSDAYASQHPELQRRLRRAMKAGELELHYQPKLDLRSRKITAVEALLRWRRSGELVPPGDFLPQAEQTEVMGPLTLHVADLALAQAARWREEGVPVGVAINLSPFNLADDDLPAQLAGMVQKYGVLPDNITLEVTETAAIDDPERAAKTLTTLGGLGFRLSIDDFGTGESSLSRLDQLPFRELKIDISLIRAMEKQGNPALVRSIIGLAHQLELWVVAEGVESEEAMRRLAELGCDLVQGYGISKPVDADRIADLVRDYERRAVIDSIEAQMGSREARRLVV